MKKLFNYLSANRIIFIKIGALFFTFLILIFIMHKILKTQPVDFSDAINKIDEQQKKDKLELIDSIRQSYKLIELHRNEISKLNKRLIQQDLTIAKIKQDADKKRIDVVSMGIDSVVSESKRQLSK